MHSLSRCIDLECLNRGEKMLIKLKVSAQVGGVWKKPGVLVTIDDVEAMEMIQKKQAENANPIGALSSGKDEPSMDHIIEELISIDGIDDKLVGDLIDAGYTSVDKLSDAKAEALVGIKGIGQKTAEKIIDSAIDIFNARK